MRYDEDIIIGYCDYCHDIVQKNEDYIHIGEGFFHLDCYKQQCTYFDSCDCEENFNDEFEAEGFEIRKGRYYK